VAGATTFPFRTSFCWSGGTAQGGRAGAFFVSWACARWCQLSAGGHGACAPPQSGASWSCTSAKVLQPPPRLVSQCTLPRPAQRPFLILHLWAAGKPAVANAHSQRVEGAPLGAHHCGDDGDDDDDAIDRSQITRARDDRQPACTRTRTHQRLPVSAAPASTHAPGCGTQKRPHALRGSPGTTQSVTDSLPRETVSRHTASAGGGPSGCCCCCCCCCC
jgi:hypothetical protein